MAKQYFNFYSRINNFTIDEFGNIGRTVMDGTFNSNEIGTNVDTRNVIQVRENFDLLTQWRPFEIYHIGGSVLKMFGCPLTGVSITCDKVEMNIDKGGGVTPHKYESIQAFIDSADNNDPDTPIYYFAKTSEMFTTNAPPKALYMRPCYQKGDSDCNSIQLVWQGEGWEPGYVLLKHNEGLGGAIYTTTLLNYRFNHPNDILNFTYNGRYYISYLDKHTNKDSYLYWIPSIKRIGNFQDRASNWQKGDTNSNWYGVIEMTEAASRKYAGIFI